MEISLDINPLQVFIQFDWNAFLFGEEKWEFIFEVTIRTIIMFSIILASLRLLGKRGIKQLSVFELGVIIALGSAAGDPMFYKDVGVVFGMLVLAVVVILYRLLTYLTEKSERLEKIVEGSATYIIKNGAFIMSEMKKEPLSYQEFFAQLRLNNVSHLGQVKIAIAEATGEISLFFYQDEEVKFGLPILPHLYDNFVETINETNIYACNCCGTTQSISPQKEFHCPECKNNHWVKATNEKRNN
ncbi:MAG: DUF421 domain-containing protein [Chitinophagaceae bacterium]|jgi:uncharacterized membrane protein YcaP (DUF421 family)|nr:DUF421 domain-containing protein [Chitinophagaceae bacterium]